MKIALLGDVHANLPALEAVLNHLTTLGCAAIWNIGDFLGYGAYPNEVIQRLKGAGALSIVGNYDLKVLRFPRKRKKWAKTKRAEKYLAFEWAHKMLSEKNRQYLETLPLEIRFELAGIRVLLTHASPASNEEPLTPQTPESRLEELAAGANVDLVVCGHSHQPFARQAAGVWFVNTGSVGRADDGDPRACYAVLELETGSLKAQHHRVAYDIARAVTAIRAHHLPEAFAQMMLQGYDLDTILAQEGAAGR